MGPCDQNACGVRACGRGETCRAPQSVEDVPEITLDDVKRIVRRDAELKALAADVAAKIDVRQGKGLEDGFVLEATGVVGIAPGASDWPDVLFPHLVDLFAPSKDEADEVMGMVREPVGVRGGGGARVRHVPGPDVRQSENTPDAGVVRVDLPQDGPRKSSVPQEAFEGFLDVVDALKRSRNLSERAFQAYLSAKGAFGREDEARRDLLAAGVRLVDEVGLCGPERTEELGRELHRRFASSPLASQSIRTRTIFSI